MISYLIEILIYQALFLGLYQLLKKEPYFKVNRFYLLFSLVISLGIPVVNFGGILPATVSQPYIEYLQPIQIGETIEQSLTSIKADKTHTPNSFEANPFFLIYFVGLVICTFLIFRQNKGLFKLFKLKKSSEYKSKSVVILPHSGNAFSFWNTIYLGEKIPKEQQAYILEHEYQHLKLKHSIDLISLQLLMIVLWFNPLLYLYKRFLSQVHEFEADKNALAKSSKTAYINTLLNQKFKTANISFVHPFFNSSNLKNRIKMIKNSNNRKQRLVKYVLVLPVILLCVLISCTQEEMDIPQLTDEEIKEQSKAFFEKLIKEDPSILEVLQEKPALKELLGHYKMELKSNYSPLEEDKIGILLGLSIKLTKNKEAYNTSLLNQIENNKALKAIYDNTLEKLNSATQTKEETQIQEYDNEDDSRVPYALIENPPYPVSCDGIVNDELKKCTSQFIAKHVNSNFDAKKFENLSSGRHRISVQFVISRDGYVYNAKARGPSPELEEEALRCVNSLPQFEPGKNANGERVAVVYGLPINFLIN